MLAELKNSTEPKELVKRAQEYLRGVIGGIVRRKKELEARKNTANGAAIVQALTGHASMQPIHDTVGGQDASGHTSSASMSNSGHRRGKENRQSGATFPIQGPGEVWEV